VRGFREFSKATGKRLASFPWRWIGAKGVWAKPWAGFKGVERQLFRGCVTLFFNVDCPQKPNDDSAHFLFFISLLRGDELSFPPKKVNAILSVLGTETARG